MTSATEKTLREKLVEAMAKAYHNNDPAYAPPYWDDCYPEMKTHYRSVSTAALDALLDTLSENAGDWRNEARVAWMEDHYGNEKTISALIAALRDTDTGPEEK